MDEPEVLANGEQIVTERDQGAFVSSTMSSEEARRRGAMGNAKKHFRKEATLLKRARRLTDAIINTMPALETQEANEARTYLIEEYARLATADKGSPAVSALNDLARRIGDSFAALTKLEPGQKCPRCQSIVGKEAVKVSLDPGGALWTMLQIWEQRGASPERLAILREIAEAWEETHGKPSPRPAEFMARLRGDLESAEG